MPQIKRVAQAGKMNRDLDEKLVPNGEYREALNVNVGRSEGSNVGSIENLLGNSIVSSGVAEGKVIGAYRDNGNERIYFFVTDDTDCGVYEFDQQTQLTTKLVTENLTTPWLRLRQSNPVEGINVLDGLLFWTDNLNEPRKINIDRAKNDNSYYNDDAKTAVAKIAPIDAPRVNVIGLGGDSNFLENKLVRFAYRYQYNDNEYSTISLFTPVVFRNDEILTDLSSYISSGEIATFVNQARSIQLSLTVPRDIGITGVELLYKETTNNTIYIIDERELNTDGLLTDPEVSFIYNSQDPFRAIPSSQTTRVYDAVPRLAQSQEVAGSRIVYGNFLQNYNLPNVSFSVTSIAGSHDVLSNHSVKSNRTYQVGLVLSDRFGRQSPVILSSTGSDTVFVSPQTDPGEFRRKLLVTFNNLDEIPDEWVNYRVVVKQRESDYYNWFTTGAANARIRTGDSVNKVSIDQTIQVASNAVARPSLEQVYRKVSGGVNVADTNPYRVSIAQNSNATVIDDSSTGISVYETRPQESNLDIFFETSTGGTLAGIVSGAVEVDFYNCYILNFGQNVHIEVNRIRAGFNEPSFDLGVKAYAVQENFAEERRANALIHSSGLFNSRTGINQLNQFNEAEGGLILGLDPSDGSIQKLYAEDTQLLIFQEDKVSRSPIDKDFIYSAEGGAVPVTSSTQYLGTVAPYSGEYGISLDPGSFAVYGTRKYFTDKNRGVVLRLSNDGLSEISRAGMSDFFRDALKSSTNIIGSFDEYHNQYNLTIEGVAYDGAEDTNIATASEGYFTVSFEEDVKGWVSFKSFLQERGTTLNNTYYTFSKDLWEHNRIDEPRNSFYGADPAASEIEFVFNDSPSAIKHFNTLSYEGTEGWECDSIITDLDEIGEERELTQYFTNTLQITGSVGNADVTGERAFTQVAGTTVEWRVVVTPRPGFQFDSDHNVVFTFEGTTYQPANTDDGTLRYNLFDIDIDPEKVVRAATISGQATLIETVTSITVMIDDDGLENSSANINSQVFATLPGLLDLVITPEVDYYFDSPTQVTFTVTDLLHLGSIFTVVNNNLNFDSQITDTDGEGPYIYTFTGSPLKGPELTYNIQTENATIDGYTGPFTFAYVPGRTDEIDFIITPDIEYVYVDPTGDSTITPVHENVTVSNPEIGTSGTTFMINAGFNKAQGDVEYMITIPGPTLISATDDSGDLTNFAASGATPQSVTVVKNAPGTITVSDQTWAEISVSPTDDTGNEDVIIVITILEDNTTGSPRTAEITIDIDNSVNQDSTITITQDA